MTFATLLKLQKRSRPQFLSSLLLKCEKQLFIKFGCCYIVKLLTKCVPRNFFPKQVLTFVKIRIQFACDKLEMKIVKFEDQNEKQ